MDPNQPVIHIIGPNPQEQAIVSDLERAAIVVGGGIAIGALLGGGTGALIGWGLGWLINRAIIGKLPAG